MRSWDYLKTSIRGSFSNIFVFWLIKISWSGSSSSSSYFKVSSLLGDLYLEKLGWRLIGLGDHLGLGDFTTIWSFIHSLRSSFWCLSFSLLLLLVYEKDIALGDFYLLYFSPVVLSKFSICFYFRLNFSSLFLYSCSSLARFPILASSSCKSMSLCSSYCLFLLYFYCLTISFLSSF